MSSHVMFFAWNRSLPGREKVSLAHFDEFMKYLGRLQQNGSIQGFDVVFLDTHGGDMNGFFLIKGEPAKLDTMASSTEWITHMTRASLHAEGCGAIRGVAGEECLKRLAIWSAAVPS